jgi:hypothetical protein
MASVQRMIAIVLGLGAHGGCGGEPGVPKAEHEALLQRLDAMDQRLDALEEALERRPALGEGLRLPPDHAAGAGTPASDPARPPAHGAILKVRVTAAGLEIDGTLRAPADALSVFRDVALVAPHTRLTVIAEPDAPYAAVVDALDLAREAGLTDIAMSARIHGEGEAEAGG